MYRSEVIFPSQVNVQGLHTSLGKSFASFTLGLGSRIVSGTRMLLLVSCTLVKYYFFWSEVRFWSRAGVSG